MADDSGTLQALALLGELYEQVERISRRVERAEMQSPRTSVRGIANNHRQRSALRRELYEAHRHIDGIHRRFPETLRSGHAVQRRFKRWAPCAMRSDSGDRGTRLPRHFPITHLVTKLCEPPRNGQDAAAPVGIAPSLTAIWGVATRRNPRYVSQNSEVARCYRWKRIEWIDGVGCYRQQ